MRALSKAALTLCVAALLAAPAWAQFRGGFGGRGGGAGNLLRNQGVQKELELTEEQREKLREALQDVQAKHKEDLEKLRNRDTSMEERREIFQKINEATNKAVAGILNKDQAKRLKQIELQQRGLIAFADEEVQKALKLTDEQKDKLRTINEDLRRDMRDLFTGGGGNREEAFKKMAALNREGMEKVQAVLTDEQKKAWKEMTGEPFQVRFPGGRRPGGERRPRSDGDR